MNMDHPHVIKNITGYNIVDDENVSRKSFKKSAIT
jgi:hypothetical protein